MVNKGICETCIYDNWCVFPRKFPVLQCEEFIVCGPKPKNIKKTKRLKKKGH